MKKERLNELLNYTRSKKILRIVFLYNNEEVLDKIIELYTNLYNSNRSDSEKSDLIMAYIKNRKLENIEYLVCNSQITNNYTYKEQKEIINKYISSKISFEQIVNNCYIKSFNNDFETNQDEEINPKEHKKDKKLDKSTNIITSNKNILKYRSNKEIYDLIKVYYKDDKGILINLIINDDILKYRNNYEHISLLNLYLEYPYKRVYDLIIDSKILRKTSLYEQNKLIDMYLDNQSEETYNKIKESINKRDPYEKADIAMKKDIKNYKKLLFKTTK